MAYLGRNKDGEQVHVLAAGCRVVMKNGQVEASSITGFDPYTNNLRADNRFKTVLELVEGVCRINDHDICGVGAGAAVRAMARHWESHLAEGNHPNLIINDLQDTKERIDRIIIELASAFGIDNRVGLAAVPM